MIDKITMRTNDIEFVKIKIIIISDLPAALRIIPNLQPLHKPRRHAHARRHSH